MVDRMSAMLSIAWVERLDFLEANALTSRATSTLKGGMLGHVFFSLCQALLGRLALLTMEAAIAVATHCAVDAF